MSGIGSPSVPFSFPTTMPAEWGSARWDSRLRTPESGGFVGEAASRRGFACILLILSYSELSVSA